MIEDKMSIQKWIQTLFASEKIAPLRYDNFEDAENYPPDLQTLIKKIHAAAPSIKDKPGDMVLRFRLEDSMGLIDETSLKYGIDVSGYPSLNIYLDGHSFMKSQNWSGEQNKIPVYMKKIPNPFNMHTPGLYYYYQTYMSSDEGDKGLTERFLIVSTRNIPNASLDERLGFNIHTKTDNPIIRNLMNYYEKDSVPVSGNLGVKDDVDVFILTKKKYSRWDPKLKFFRKIAKSLLKANERVKIVSFVNDDGSVQPDAVITYDKLNSDYLISCSSQSMKVTKVRDNDDQWPGIESQFITNETGDWFINIHSSDFMVLMTKGEEWRKRVIEATSKRSSKYYKGRYNRWESNIHCSQLILLEGDNIHRRTIK